MGALGRRTEVGACGRSNAAPSHDRSSPIHPTTTRREPCRRKRLGSAIASACLRLLQSALCRSPPGLPRRALRTLSTVSLEAPHTTPTATAAARAAWGAGAQCGVERDARVSLRRGESPHVRRRVPPPFSAPSRGANRIRTRGLARTLHPAAAVRPRGQQRAPLAAEAAQDASLTRSSAPGAHAAPGRLAPAQLQAPPLRVVRWRIGSRCRCRALLQLLLARRAAECVVGSEGAVSLLSGRCWYAAMVYVSVYGQRDVQSADRLSAQLAMSAQVSSMQPLRPVCPLEHRR